jgi:acyl carrier protein
MNREEIHQRLLGIFRDVLDNESIVLSDQTTAEDVPGWDSLSHINLIVAVEKGFGISVTTRDAKRLANVGALVDLIERRVGPRAAR